MNHWGTEQEQALNYTTNKAQCRTGENQNQINQSLRAQGNKEQVQ